ncbi:MAG: UDP binding domain-containing protein, partial [Oscillospiraceae bacterium]
ILGVAYKQDIDDYRESPALAVVEILEREGAEVTYFDPWVARYKHHGKTKEGIPTLTRETVQAADLVVVTTGHTNVDYSMIQQNAKAIFDTKNAMKMIAERSNIELL